MKYNVTVYFSGSLNFDVNAESKKEAIIAAIDRFDEIPAAELEANVLDHGVSECDEIEDDEEEDDEYEGK